MFKSHFYAFKKTDSFSAIFFARLILVSTFLLATGCDWGGGTHEVAYDDIPSAEKLIKPQSGAAPARTLLFKNDSTVSYCEINLDSGSSYSGYRDKTLYPSASVSKVFLTAFALDRLGADYKFIHEWRIRKNSDGSVDAYLNSNFDPVFNIEKVLYTISILKKQGVTRIRNLFIAKSTRVYLSVLNNPHIELDNIPVSLNQSADNIKLIFNSVNWGNQTAQARSNVEEYFFKQGKHIDLPNSFSLESVVVDSQGSYSNYFSSAATIKVTSTSLFRYLKEINVNSNNYMSDALFSLLGGETEFLKFQKQRLDLGRDSLLMKTGSGLPSINSGERVDNKSTCFAILKVMHFIKLVAQKANLDLGYILLTAGVDQGTYQTDLVINKSVVLKTGRLFDVPTLNLSGIVSTQKGLMAFSFLGHNFSNDQEDDMLEKRDLLLNDLLNFYREKPLFKTLSQNEIFFL